MAETIPVFEAAVAFPLEGRPMRGRGGAETAAVRVVEQSVESLQASLERFVGGVQKMLAKGAQVVGDFRMDEVQVAAQIGAEGKIGFLGSGVAASGGASLTIVFRRVDT